MATKIRSGIFIPPIHPVDEDPTLCIQRDLELIEYVERLGFEEASMASTIRAAMNYTPVPTVHCRRRRGRAVSVWERA